MATEVKTHYVARVVFERVDKTSHQEHPSKEPSTTREVIEVANFTVKADDLEMLKGRLQNHIGLVDE